MPVTVRTVSDGEGVSIGPDITVRVEFPATGGRRVKLVIEERSRFPVSALPRGESQQQPQRDSQLAERARE